MSLENEVAKLARMAGGSFKTVSDRENILRKFARILKHDLNVQIRTAGQIKISHIEAYIKHRLSEGANIRTLQNEMSAFRSTLKEAGKFQLLNNARISNKALGLSGASREGTKHAIPNDLFHEIFRDALAKNQEIAACILLSRRLGLRSEEVVQSCQSLESWQKCLDAGSDNIRVIFGTKGGRPRDVYIHPAARNEIQQAIQFANAIASKNSGKIISKPTLKSAMHHFHNQCRALGLKGVHAPHSLRYAYAVDQLQRYLDAGFSGKEALAATSCDLGHGDGRGYYIQRVYTK